MPSNNDFSVGNDVTLTIIGGAGGNAVDRARLGRLSWPVAGLTLWPSKASPTHSPPIQ